MQAIAKKLKMDATTVALWFANVSDMFHFFHLTFCFYISYQIRAYDVASSTEFDLHIGARQRRKRVRKPSECAFSCPILASCSLDSTCFRSYGGGIEQGEAASACLGSRASVGKQFSFCVSREDFFLTIEHFELSFRLDMFYRHNSVVLIL